MAIAEPQKEYLLALKVMRLTRPTLVAPKVITSEPKDLVGNLFTEILENDVTSVLGTETLSAGQFMLLPQSFGNIYLGETFSSYICVHNCTPNPVQSVVIKADIQLNEKTIPLPIHHTKQTPITLQPNETLDHVIHHEVKEIGIHFLTCEVHYTTPSHQPEKFRKFFKFHVFKPLDVKTKFYNAEMDEIYLEAQIQNITAGPICLESVELENSEHYTSQPLNTLPNGESVFKSRNMLEPQNSCQFLYCIKPIPSLANDPKALTALNNIGKLDILWRSNLGERGQIQTSQLHRSPLPYGELRLTVLEARNTCKIGEPYDITCRLTNTSERSMELQLNMNTITHLGCGYTGLSEFSLGTLDTEKCKEFKLTVCPVRLGLITIGGLQLTDVFLKQTYKFEDFVQVFVVDKNYRDDEPFDMEKFVRYGVEKMSMSS